MCGIHGIISQSIKKAEMYQKLSQMGETQQHRGPDDRKNEVYRHNRWLLGLGFVRLSILDLQTGMQPIRCSADDSAIICNGQVYNYLELKEMVASEPFVSKGDIEVALHLYRKKGIGFLDLLNGMYAGAIFDPLKERLLLFRDRFGIKPVYYTEYNGNFVFASEIKPVLQGSGMPPRLNESGLGTFFSYRYLPGSKTMFNGVNRLPPGSYLDYDLSCGKYKVVRYWEYKLNRPNRNISWAEAEEELFYLFSDAVKIRLRSDVEVGCFLSGGIDSSAVAERCALNNSDVKLFSILFSDPQYDEQPGIGSFIRSKPERFKKTKHYFQKCGPETLKLLPELIRSLEDLISLGAIFPTNLVCQLASRYVKVVLTGEGADEIFGGYRKFLIEMAAAQYPHLSYKKQMLLINKYPELSGYLEARCQDPAARYIQSELLFTADELQDLLGVELNGDDMLPHSALPVLDGSESPVNAAIAIESRLRLPDYVILRLDKLSMRHSLEARTPFLDYRIAEFAATLPVDFKINLDLGLEKYICRRTYVHQGMLDQTTAFRKKQPFTVPLAPWLSTPCNLPDFLREVIEGDVIKKQGLLNSKMVKGIAQRVTTEGVGPSTLVSEADRLFAISVFTLWYEEFIKG